MMHESMCSLMVPSCTGSDEARCQGLPGDMTHRAVQVNGAAVTLALETHLEEHGQLVLIEHLLHRGWGLHFCAGSCQCHDSCLDGRLGCFCLLLRACIGVRLPGILFCLLSVNPAPHMLNDEGAGCADQEKPQCKPRRSEQPGQRPTNH